MEDRRAKLKSLVRKNPLLAKILQWLFDPAFTPRYLINRWVKEQKGVVLNFGSGSCAFGQNVINLDVEDLANVHVVNKSDRIPFKENTFDAVLLEYVLEHVPNYGELIKEVRRVTKPGGTVLVTVPFRQNYHACPQDYWRFTHQGLENLFSQLGFDDVNVDVYGGPVSAWIDATKEFLATIFSFGIPVLYDIFSQLFIIPFIPLRYLDILFRKLPVAKYTAFSFIATAKKPGILQTQEEVCPIAEKLEEVLWTPENYQIQQKGSLYWVDKVELVKS